MTKTFTSWCLFFSSYSLLFLLLGLRFQDLAPRSVALALGVIGVGLQVLVLVHARYLEPQEYTITSVVDRGADVGGYLVAYLLPFLVVPEPTGGELVAYIAFLAIAGVIYVRSELIYINPLLYVLGYRVTTVETAEGYTGTLITRRALTTNANIRAARIRNLVLVEF